jgi:hypothetical protein
VLEILTGQNARQPVLQAPILNRSVSCVSWQSAPLHCFCATKLPASKQEQYGTPESAGATAAARYLAAEDDSLSLLSGDGAARASHRISDGQGQQLARGLNNRVRGSADFATAHFIQQFFEIHSNRFQTDARPWHTNV